MYVHFAFREKEFNAFAACGVMNRAVVCFAGV